MQAILCEEKLEVNHFPSRLAAQCLAFCCWPCQAVACRSLVTCEARAHVLQLGCTPHQDTYPNQASSWFPWLSWQQPTCHAPFGTVSSEKGFEHHWSGL